MINSRSLDDLHPHVKDLCSKFLVAALAGAEKADVIVTSTYRDNECQTALYQQGRSNVGAIVTNAKAGESFHNYRLAFDFAPLVLGKIPWNDGALFTRLGILGESIGLEWAGRWRGPMREMAHLQWTGGLTIADLQAGKKPPDA